MKAYIYTLQCEATGYVYYVGATKNIEVRMYQHQTERARSNNAFYTWWRNSDIKLKIETLEEIEYTERFKLHLLESFWIEQLRAWGFDLKNQAKKTSLRNSNPNNKDYGLISISLGAQLKTKLNNKAKQFDRSPHNYAKLIIREYIDGKLVYAGGDGPLLR